MVQFPWSAGSRAVQVARYGLWHRDFATRGAWQLPAPATSVPQLVSDTSRQLFEASNQLPGQDTRGVLATHRLSSHRRAWAGFLSRVGFAAGPGSRIGTAITLDAVEMVRAATTADEVLLIDQQMQMLDGWTTPTEIVIRLADLAAFEAREELVHSVAALLETDANERGNPISDATAERYVGLTMLQLAINEASTEKGPCDVLNKLRAKHLYALTRRGERGWRAAADIFDELRSKGLASWELTAVVLATMPSLAAQKNLVNALESELGQCTSANVYNVMARNALLRHQKDEASHWLATAKMCNREQSLPPDRFTMRYERWLNDEKAHKHDKTKAFQRDVGAAFASGSADAAFHAWEMFHCIPDVNVTSGILETALKGCRTARTQMELLEGFPMATDIRCFNRVLNRCAAEGDDSTAHNVIRMLKSSKYPPTPATERALRRCLAPDHPLTDNLGLADMRCELLESLFRWEKYGVTVLPSLVRHLIDRSCLTHEHLEILLYGAASLKDEELREAAVEAGVALGLLAPLGSSDAGLFFRRGLYSVSTLVMFASIPPALFML